MKMNEREYKDNSGWATFGKFVGVVGAIAAVGGAGYGTFTLIYNNAYSAGYGTAKYESQEEVREQKAASQADYDKKLQDLVDAGRLIPESSCLRAHVVNNALTDIYGSGNCEGLTFRVDSSKAEVVYHDAKAKLNKRKGSEYDPSTGKYQEKFYDEVSVEVFKKTDATWNDATWNNALR